MLRLIRQTSALRKQSGLVACVLTAVSAILTAAPSHGAETSAGPNGQQRRNLVAAHLEFGEFARAVDVAKSGQNAEEKSQLLALVANAQLRAGDSDAARGSIRMIPDQSERQQARSQLAAQQGLAGGAQADFTELINLIQEETSGMWEAVDGQGGTISQFSQGVHVDPTGMLVKLSQEEHSGHLRDLGIRSRQAALNEDVARASQMRVVSLSRLEQAVAGRIGDGKAVVDSMKHLAGLTKVTHVFVYPEQGEIVIAGPAEAWQYNASGVSVGIDSGRPILQLDDFVDILRAFSAGGQKVFSCSINPRPEGLQRLKQAVEQSNARGPLPAGTIVRNWVNQLQQALGRQDIVYSGINPESRVARVIIEADYRMKLIGIGKHRTDANIPSIFDLLTVQEQKASKLDALRWWLTMKYDSVLHAPDGNAFEFVGSSVLCQSENQFLNEQGQQVQTGQSEGANRLFAERFTAQYDDLAKQDLVFADLRNVFDLALVASLVHSQGVAEKAGWHYGVFGNDGAYHPATYDAPREVDSVVNHRVYRGRDIVVQVAGGVRADLGLVLNDTQVFQPAARVDTVAEQAQVRERTTRRWWWDVR